MSVFLSQQIWNVQGLGPPALYLWQLPLPEPVLAPHFWVELVRRALLLALWLEHIAPDLSPKQPFTSSSWNALVTAVLAASALPTWTWAWNHRLTTTKFVKGISPWRKNRIQISLQVHMRGLFASTVLMNSSALLGCLGEECRPQSQCQVASTRIVQSWRK